MVLEKLGDSLKNTLNKIAKAIFVDENSDENRKDQKIDKILAKRIGMKHVPDIGKWNERDQDKQTPLRVLKDGTDNGEEGTDVNQR